MEIYARKVIVTYNIVDLKKIIYHILQMQYLFRGDPVRLKTGTVVSCPSRCDTIAPPPLLIKGPTSAYRGNL